MKRLMSLVLVVFILGVFLTATTFPALAAPRVLKCSYAFPPTNRIGESTRWFTKELEKRTGYKIEEYWGGTFGKVQDLPKLCADGVVDIFCSAFGYNPNIFQLTRGFELMYVTENPYAQGAAAREMYKSYAPFRNEWEKNGLIWVASSTISGMVTLSKTPINKITDVKGLKSRGYAGVVKMIQLLGGVPIAISWNEIHEALNRGLVDVAFGIPYNSAYSARFWEPAPYVVDLGVGIYSVSGGVMSKKTYESFPPDVRKTVDQLIEDTQIQSRKILERLDREETEKMAGEKSIHLIRWSSEEKAKARKIVVPSIWEDWLKEMQAAKLSGDEFLSIYRKLLEKYEAQFPYESPFSYYESIKNKK